MAEDSGKMFGEISGGGGGICGRVLNLLIKEATKREGYVNKNYCVNLKNLKRIIRLNEY